jgi:hypothetical protein
LRYHARSGGDTQVSLNSTTFRAFFLQRRFAQALGAALSLLLLMVTLPASAPARSGAFHGFANWPRTVVWAWERPEQLKFIDAASTGVAFLASTVELSGEHTIVNPRRQPLHAPAAARLMAVVRVEARAATLSRDQREAAVHAIVAASRLPRVSAVQIDFDATLSQRDFYRELLREVRARLPQTPISITALASWCFSDDWIAGLPVDEAVPMLFRMGRDDRTIRARLRAGDDFREPLCRASVGMSTDEPPAMQPGGRRVYWFAPRSWTQTALLSAEEVAR